MSTVIFYEKPGCKGNARQKALLTAAGHLVEARNLKAEPWTKARLYAFLCPLPVSQWFNPSAPAIRDGEIDPLAFSADEALSLLVVNPLLIRRPLLEVGEERRGGFVAKDIDAWIGLSGVALPADSTDYCAHGTAGHTHCGAHDEIRAENSAEP